VTSRWLEVARRLRGLIVTSEYMKRELIAVGIPAAKIAVNPLFALPASTDKSEIRNLKFEIAEGLPVVLFCGRMYDYKGAEFLLRALEHLAIAVRAVFIGDGPELPQLKEQATRFDSLHAIEFTGWLVQEVVHEFYRQASVVVVPSLWPEPFGRVGIEAMAYGKPVVAFRVGGISEWLHDGQNGFFVEPKNVQQLAETIERILVDKPLAEKLSSNALKLASEQFSPERHVKRLLEILR
jgi:glycosyltransferase involved in cell wall biosynthesis